MYGLSTQEQAPEAFAKLSSRHVPRRALLLSGGLVFLFIPILLSGDSFMKAFTVISSVASTLILFMWSLILVAYIRYRKSRPDAHRTSTYKMPGATWTPIVGLLFFVFMVGLLAYYPDTRLALMLTPVWFIGLGIAWQVQKKTKGVRHFEA